jgi:hypothetical protein
MNYEVVFNVFLGMLALLGWTPVILFLIVFREEKTIHPIYRSARKSSVKAHPRAKLSCRGLPKRTHSSDVPEQ